MELIFPGVLPDWPVWAWIALLLASPLITSVMLQFVSIIGKVCSLVSEMLLDSSGLQDFTFDKLRDKDRKLDWGSVVWMFVFSAIFVFVVFFLLPKFYEVFSFTDE